jgi:hypothetical protein
MPVENPEVDRKREEDKRFTNEVHKLAAKMRSAGRTTQEINEIIKTAATKEVQEFVQRRDAQAPKWKNQDERKSIYTSEVRNNILAFAWKTQGRLVDQGFIYNSRELNGMVKRETINEFKHLKPPLSSGEYHKTINGSSENTYARPLKLRTTTAPTSIKSST